MSVKGNRNALCGYESDRESMTAKQKSELIAGGTELRQKVLGKKPATTVVVIDEVDTDNWGIAGEQVTLRRNRGK